MPLVEKKDIDEVVLALNASFDSFGRNGHKPNENMDSCDGCHAMALLKRAMEVYPKRLYLAGLNGMREAAKQENQENKEMGKS